MVTEKELLSLSLRTPVRYIRTETESVLWNLDLLLKEKDLAFLQYLDKVVAQRGYDCGRFDGRKIDIPLAGDVNLQEFNWIRNGTQKSKSKIKFYPAFVVELVCHDLALSMLPELSHRPYLISHAIVERWEQAINNVVDTLRSELKPVGFRYSEDSFGFYGSSRDEDMGVGGLFFYKVLDDEITLKSEGRKIVQETIVRISPNKEVVERLASNGGLWWTVNN